MSHRITVTSLKELPKGTHYAILTIKSTHVPGDERSRTNPGHGYPAHTVHSVNYEMFTDKQEWIDAVKARTLRNLARTYSSDEFVPIVVQRADVHTHVDVRVHDFSG